MAVYGGFDPGTFQPWALNLLQNSLGVAGIARGMSVTPATPASMNVVVNVDPTEGDGVCFLANGAWVRIDANVTLAVPANSSGSTRTDAVVAEVDPTGVGGAPQIAYITGWTTGYAGSGYGTPSSPSNQLVLALVTVPNGAASIGSSNIVQTPLRAGVGGSGPTALQSIIADASGLSSQLGVFTAADVILSTGATNNQTTFSVPLSGRQKLVPMGKIGGQTEVGFFAGVNGWYVPRLIGSTSGVLPVASVDNVNGNIISAKGAVAGEVITAAFKYYDFSFDTLDWGNVQFLERDSPFIVIAGDARPGSVHLNAEVWEGARNGIIVQNGDVVYVTFIGNAILARFRSGQTSGISTKFVPTINGSANTAYTIGTQPNLPYHAEGQFFSGLGSNAIQQVAYTITQGMTEFGGALLSSNPANSAFYFDGGEGVVNGFPVFAASTSVGLGGLAPLNGAPAVLYMDRFGNVTATVAVQAVGEMYNGRIPLAKAPSFGVGATNSSAWYGTYALPNQPNGTRPTVIVGNTTITVKAVQQTHGWDVQPDATSPYGGYLVTYSANDTMFVSWAGSGLDMTFVPVTATTVFVNILNQTSYYALVSGSSGSRVHLTLCSNFPAQTMMASVKVPTGNTGLGFEEAAIRIPAVPMPQAVAMPLSYAFLSGPNNIRRSPWLRQDLSVVEKIAGGTALLVDPNRWAPGGSLWMSNTTIGSQIACHIASYTAGRVAFMGGPSCGIATVRVGNTTVTVDTYQGSWAPVYSSWITGANDQQRFEVDSTGTKNGSSTGFDLYPLSADTFEYPALFISTRQLPNDGVHPSIKGSALLGSQGQLIQDSAYGIATDHIQDRAVTSRKITPTWVNVITSQNYSGGSTDPFLVASITVEVPSMLLLQLGAPIKMNAGDGVQGQFIVDGAWVAGATPVYAADNPGTGTLLQALSAVYFYPVTAGSHTVQVDFRSYGTAHAPFFDGTTTRSLTILAFAL